MRILIAGGFGLLGGRLSDYLQRLGHDIVLGSRTSKTAPEWLPRALVIKMDWGDSRALEESCSDVDVVIHAAGANASICSEDPVFALESNGVATARLVAAARQSLVKRFIYLSTAHVYASPLSGTITEETCPRNVHPYATSHRAGEDAVLYASARGEIEGIVLRLSNAFGRPMHSGVNCWMLLANDLCRQAVENRTMVLQTGGSQQRDFIPIADVCRVVGYFANRSAIAAPTQRIVNVGSGRTQTVLEMAEYIRARCGEVLGFIPDLQRPFESSPSSMIDLSYQSEHLTSSELVSWMGDEKEMDQLLLACAEWYGKVRNA